MRSQTESIPAPTGGWNARDSITAMPLSDAIQMINGFPNTTDVQARRGMLDHVTGITGKTVESLMAYNHGGGSKLFASVDNNIYDVSIAGAASSAESGTTVTNSRWQYVNHKVPGGAHYLYMVNGTDKPMLYDNSSWLVITHETAISMIGFPGNSLEELIHVNIHKRRLWFVRKDTSEAWYLAVDAVGGALTKFDVGGVFSEGGFLMAMATWTLDAGTGIDDHAVFISNKGQVAIYTGTDPGSASTWALVGVFNIGSPIGRRCFTKASGDVLIITQDGLMPLAAAMQNARISQDVAVSDKIRTALNDAVASYKNNFGWQVILYPNANVLLVNIPLTGFVFDQYVMNTITGAWCRFCGWNASCWELFNDELYFGGVETVVKAWTGNSDNGNNVVADILPAQSYFGSYNQKIFTMARPVFSANGSPAVVMDMNVDFENLEPVGSATLPAASGFEWDVDKWGEGVWGGAFESYKEWHGVSGIGFAGALHMKIITNYFTVKWQSTDYIFQKGSPI